MTPNHWKARLIARRDAIIRAIRTTLPIVGLLCATQVGAEAGISATEVLIGQTGSQTGTLASHNQAFTTGAQLYFDALNTRGGVHGRKIRMLTMDDGYDPDRALENARKLIEEKRVFALFACFGTGPSMKVLPFASSRAVPFFAPYSGASSVRSAEFPFAFHVRASYDAEIEKIVEHLTMLGIGNIAIVHHDDDFGKAGLSAALAAMSTRQVKPVATLSIRPDGSDAVPVVNELARINPAALIMITAGSSSSALIRTIRSADVHPQLYGLSVLSSTALLSELGELANGMVVTQVVPSPYRLEAPVASAYRQASETSGQTPTYAGLEGYIAAKTFAEALERAGESPTRDDFISALGSMKRYDAGGYTLSYSAERHAGSQYVDLSLVNHGRFTH